MYISFTYLLANNFGKTNIELQGNYVKYFYFYWYPKIFLMKSHKSKIFDLSKISLFPKWKNSLENVWFKQDFRLKQEICSSRHLALIMGLHIFEIKLY